MGEICTPEAHRAPYRVGALQETPSDPQPPASPLPFSVTLLIHGTPTPALHTMPDPPSPRPVSWGLGVSAPCRPLVNGQRTEEPSSSSEASAKGIEMTWYRGRTWGPWPDEAGCGEPMMDRVSVQRRLPGVPSCPGLIPSRFLRPVALSISRERSLTQHPCGRRASAGGSRATVATRLSPPSRRGQWAASGGCEQSAA